MTRGIVCDPLSWTLCLVVITWKLARCAQKMPVILLRVDPRAFFGSWTLELLRDQTEEPFLQNWKIKIFL